MANKFLLVELGIASSSTFPIYQQEDMEVYFTNLYRQKMETFVPSKHFVLCADEFRLLNHCLSRNKLLVIELAQHEKCKECHLHTEYSLQVLLKITPCGEFIDEAGQVARYKNTRFFQTLLHSESNLADYRSFL